MTEVSFFSRFAETNESPRQGMHTSVNLFCFSGAYLGDGRQKKVVIPAQAGIHNRRNCALALRGFPLSRE
ncbi:hypothetical protein [Telmatospirillum sp.]|uniref:hypothetical protein n=1 Tax=Telmatospirillum sp. TaxID=2079197 RepID=UPI002850FEF8|nr:hypothetical protein [Telmatospirillum sp.]MDR3436489.1 hypothetical protein [Telmatospirillum sp.]